MAETGNHLHGSEPDALIGIVESSNQAIYNPGIFLAGTVQCVDGLHSTTLVQRSSQRKTTEPYWPTNCGALSVSRADKLRLLTSFAWSVIAGSVTSWPSELRRAGVTVKLCPAILFLNCSSVCHPGSAVQYGANCSCSLKGIGIARGTCLPGVGLDCGPVDYAQPAQDKIRLTITEKVTAEPGRMTFSSGGSCNSLWPLQKTIDT